MLTYVVIVVLTGLVFYALYSYVANRLKYYRSLGARIVGFRFLNPVASLGDVLLFTEGSKGMHSLVVEIQTYAFGYIRLRKRDILDKLLFQKAYRGLSIEYEDENWANKLLSLESFVGLVDKLFEDYRVSWIELKGNKLRVGWYIKKGPVETEKEKLLKVIEIVKNLRHISKTFPVSGTYRGALREWITFRIPVALTIILFITGIVGRFYQYTPTCMSNMILTGFKLLFPIVFLYASLSLVLVGGATMGQSVFLKTFFVCFICSFFVILFFLSYINGKFDSSKPKLKRDWVVAKYIGIARGRGGPRLVLAKHHKENPWCESFSVSKEFYESLTIGSIVEYQTKEGLFGIEWFYSGLTLVK
ncbi:MAG: hypothetical protein ACK4TF_03460 [Thermodesulfovibrionales bacterium]